LAYVTDHCDAIAPLSKRQPGETYNIGGNNEMRNIDIVQTICEILDKLGHQPQNRCHSYANPSVIPAKLESSPTKTSSPTYRPPRHDLRYAIDATKIKQDLHWEPKETFATAIRKTITC
jgi:dTDP-glucose 4,6-dehydratase